MNKQDNVRLGQAFKNAHDIASKNSHIKHLDSGINIVFQQVTAMFQDARGFDPKVVADEAYGPTKPGRKTA